MYSFQTSEAHALMILIHSGYFYSASSSPLFRGARDTARILCRSLTPKRQRQLPVKDLPNGPTWRRGRDSTLRTKGDESTTEPQSVTEQQWRRAIITSEGLAQGHPLHTLQAVTPSVSSRFPTLRVKGRILSPLLRYDRHSSTAMAADE